MNLADRLRAVVAPRSTPDPPRDTPDVARKTPEVAAKTSDLAGKAPNLAGKTPDLAGKTPDLAGNTPDLAGNTPDLKVGPTTLEQTLGGEFRELSGHRSFVVTRRHDAQSAYGRGRVGEFAERLVAAQASAPLVSIAAARPPFIFFDLETTGLSGGAGTYAFLVGCGWFAADGAFITEQHLLVDYVSERPMLRAVAHELARAGAIVSFNGKSFDAPVLETRYLFHRLEPPCGPLPHVDVLHPARRFWGDRESSCSLIALEQHILGARRCGDVPGFEIPARYFQFVRSGDARPLAAVLEHNRLDLLSLAGLTARLLHIVEHGPGETRDAREAVALGRVYARAGLDARGEQAYEHAVALCGPSMSSLRIEALRSLALSARRLRRYDAAAARWRAILESPRCPRHIAREATEALAIHHEHRVRDLRAAKMFALKSLEMAPAPGDAVRHRLARIERKMISERRTLASPSLPLQPSCDSRMSAPRTSS